MCALLSLKRGPQLTRLGSIGKAVLGVALLVALAIGGVIRINAGETPKKIRIIYTDDMMGYWRVIWGDTPKRRAVLLAGQQQYHHSLRITRTRS